MTHSSVFAKSVWERRRSFIGWSAGLIFLVVVSVAPYASFRGNRALERLVENLPGIVRALTGGETDLLSPEGWLNGRLFALMLPLLFATFAIGRGADGVAGEEADGTLELVLSAPLRRTRFALEKIASVGAGLMFLALVTLLALAITTAAAGMDVPLANVATAMAAMYLLGMFHGALALGVGAATGYRGTAIAVATIVAVSGYVLDSLAELWDVAERLRWLSPFTYADALPPLRGEPSFGDFGVLAALTTAAVGIGLWAFDRRDLRS